MFIIIITLSLSQYSIYRYLYHYIGDDVDGADNADIFEDHDYLHEVDDDIEMIRKPENSKPEIPIVFC